VFESHITFEDIPDEEFVRICKRAGVKPVVIEDDTGADRRQTMTAKFHKTDDLDQVMREVEEIAAHFPAPPLRRKVEKIVGKFAGLPDHQYLEFHLKYRVDPKDAGPFVEEVRNLGGHTSRNAMKEGYRFATARDVNTYRSLKSLPYEKVHQTMECVVHDDNPGLDVNWDGCKSCLLKPVPDFVEKM
jgi:hypothetical protein